MAPITGTSIANHEWFRQIIFEEFNHKTIWWIDGLRPTSARISNWAHNEVAKFENPAVPAATITVYAETLDKNHPLNPNPQAGPLKVFQVYNDKRAIGRPFRALPIAKAKAKALHQQMVDAIIAKRQEANPLYGIF
ncbi:hypothetical protein [Mesorhizobium sp.]|uniref:hypothetical protein n=1 Tax=Mesorhizobium sp. TaxID=1871066 RepID=UPI000FE31DB8|nr:hypothetical protein [Mesorhizobium sp.]RWI35526.1 MAG: hypothetical protein EOR14_28910 [Mesorhizobium sp.]RWJ03462.1 MAG: hypothetical protein EOR24_32290 [Mesorhizobium sp.]RWJ66305.1 MAG: hypothetical protein EOR34_28225 [Mesorhizobium sp.]